MNDRLLPLVKSPSEQPTNVSELPTNVRRTDVLPKYDLVPWDFALKPPTTRSPVTRSVVPRANWTPCALAPECFIALPINEMKWIEGAFYCHQCAPLALRVLRIHHPHSSKLGCLGGPVPRLAVLAALGLALFVLGVRG